MKFGLIAFALFAATLLPAQNQLALIRRQEQSLAAALASHDRSQLTGLLAGNFQIRWTESGLERIDTAQQGREDWINTLLGLPIDHYQATILHANVTPGSHTIAEVSLDESWSLLTPSGTRLERRFRTADIWLYTGGAWKLLQRTSHSPSPYRLQSPGH